MVLLEPSSDKEKIKIHIWKLVIYNSFLYKVLEDICIWNNEEYCQNYTSYLSHYWADKDFNGLKFGDGDGLNLCRVKKVDVSSTFYWKYISVWFDPRKFLSVSKIKNKLWNNILRGLEGSRNKWRLKTGKGTLLILKKIHIF